jgi:hypothetical protein
MTETMQGPSGDPAKPATRLELSPGARMNHIWVRPFDRRLRQLFDPLEESNGCLTLSLRTSAG